MRKIFVFALVIWSSAAFAQQLTEAELVAAHRACKKLETFERGGVITYGTRTAACTKSEALYNATETARAAAAKAAQDAADLAIVDKIGAGK